MVRAALRRSSDEEHRWRDIQRVLDGLAAPRTAEELDLGALFDTLAVGGEVSLDEFVDGFLFPMEHLPFYIQGFTQISGSFLATPLKKKDRLQSRCLRW